MKAEDKAGRDDAAIMIRKSLCALTIVTMMAMAFPSGAKAMSLSFLNFTIEAAKQPESEGIQNPSPDLTQEDKDASESAKLADKFLQDYFIDAQSSTTLTAAGMTLPLLPSEVKGISTYFTSYHPGIDIRADVGSPVLSMHEGIVVENEYQAGGYGRYVVVEHTFGTQTVRSLYAHMKSTAVEVGDKVGMGQPVGIVGMTGHSTGPHVHFETRLCQADQQYYTCVATDPIRLLTKGVPNQLAKK
ncbi:MAG: M23 family metallopeptidase [Candidatus Woesebacteria bacterium]